MAFKIPLEGDCFKCFCYLSPNKIVNATSSVAHRASDRKYCILVFYFIFSKKTYSILLQIYSLIVFISMNMEPLATRVYKNVWIKNRDMQPIKRLLSWINATLECDLKALNELCTSAIYCQLLHRICRKLVSLPKVRLYRNEHRHFELNFTILQSGFYRIYLNKEVPIMQLRAGRGHFDFINWFYKFYNANTSTVEYHPALERKSSLIGLWPKMESAQLKRRHSCFDYGKK